MCCLQHPGAHWMGKECFKVTQPLHWRVRLAQLVNRGTRVELQKMQPRNRCKVRSQTCEVRHLLRPGSLARLITASGPGEELNFPDLQQLLWFWGVLTFLHPLAPINGFPEGEFKPLVSTSHGLISFVVTILILQSLQCC